MMNILACDWTKKSINTPEWRNVVVRAPLRRYYNGKISKRRGSEGTVTMVLVYLCDKKYGLPQHAAWDCINIKTKHG